MVRLLVLMLAVGLCVACEEDTETTTEEPATETANPPRAQEEPAQQQQAEAPAEPAGGDVCTRAQSCCEGYVAAVTESMPTVTADTACVGVRQAAQAGPSGHAACEQAISAWRQSLQALNKAVPQSCQ